MVSIQVDRAWEILEPPKKKGDPDALRPVMRQAGELLATWRIHVGGSDLDGARLIAIADKKPDEPFLRLVREELRRPFDLEDLLLFLDDVLVAGDAGLRGKQVWVPGGRARNAGITIHPQDVFKKNRPRLFADGWDELNIDKPKRPAKLSPAEDGDLLGPNWSARFLNPTSDQGMLDVLAEQNASGTYAERIRSLRRQVREQGGEFYIFTTVRNRTRGYLMWGAFMLSRMKTEGGVRAGVDKLNRLNREWGLNVPIKWEVPKDWRATREAAREMSDAYDVVYATERGAKNSNHYGGKAVDIGVFGLPRSLTLTAPDGATKSWDLSAPEQTRDLNLTPELIDWVEKHFRMSKLVMDYPHWNDAAPPKSKN